MTVAVGIAFGIGIETTGNTFDSDPDTDPERTENAAL
jgi:hypothetical protein